MFFLKAVSNVTASLGYILFILLLVFGLFPLKNDKVVELSLDNIFSCNQDIVLESTEQFGAGEKQTLNNSSSDENFNSKVQELFSALNNGFSAVGSNVVMTIISCDTSLSDKGFVDTLQKYMDQDGLKEGYQYGSPDEIKEKVQDGFVYITNSLFDSNPIESFTNIFDNINSNLYVARTTYCYTPFNYSDFYIINKIESRVVMIKFDLKGSEDANIFQKYFRNLMSTTQTLKSKVFCNGR